MFSFLLLFWCEGERSPTFLTLCFLRIIIKKNLTIPRGLLTILSNFLASFAGLWWKRSFFTAGRWSSRRTLLHFCPHFLLRIRVWLFSASLRQQQSSFRLAWFLFLRHTQPYQLNLVLLYWRTSLLLYHPWYSCTMCVVKTCNMMSSAKTLNFLEECGPEYELRSRSWESHHSSSAKRLLLVVSGSIPEGGVLPGSHDSLSEPYSVSD